MLNKKNTSDVANDYSKYLLITTKSKSQSQTNGYFDNIELNRFRNITNLTTDVSLINSDKIYKLKNILWNKNISKHNSPSSKEWVNSVYSYNKNYIKSLPAASNTVNSILTSYFNLDPLTKGKKLKFNDIISKRLSLNKILVSKAEIKHTSDKINLTVYVFNRRKITLLNKIKGLITKKIKLNKPSNVLTMKKVENANNTSTDDLKLNKVYSSSLIENQKLILSKWSKGENYIKLNNILGKKNNYLKTKKLLSKGKRLVLKIRKLKNNMIKILGIKPSVLSLSTSSPFKSSKLGSNMLTLGRNTHSLLSTSLNNNSNENITFLNLFSKFELKYYSRYLQKSNIKQLLYLYYTRVLYLNDSMFKNWFLLGLKKTISQLYNKKVELNIVNQKHFYLNSDLFIKALETRVRDRNNPILSQMKTALNGVSLPRYNSNYIQRENFYSSLKEKSYLSNPNFKQITNFLKKDIFNQIKSKHIHGIRIEAAGRLTKRLTASRSLFKVKSKGNLRHIDNTHNNLGVLPLRGHFKPNLQYTNLNSKTRNGAFGLKGWVNSN